MPRADMEARKGRICETCRGPIPIERRIHARFCSKRCHQSSAGVMQYRRDYMLRYHYGMTPEEFAGKLEAQGGCCGICGDTEPGGKGGWHVDHDHATGELRDLLCHYCNIMLGMAKDDVGRLHAAMAYLERW